MGGEKEKEKKKERKKVKNLHKGRAHNSNSSAIIVEAIKLSSTLKEISIQTCLKCSVAPHRMQI
jgi:hypothetical protein